mmetsp:Transcript_10886/g.29162  ORF Transcript_10886/g.29162 Transcript_10886/m.29162 type:complete len:201 (-) Transcript_10886:597-1199(-)
MVSHALLLELEQPTHYVRPVLWVHKMEWSTGTKSYHAEAHAFQIQHLEGTSQKCHVRSCENHQGLSFCHYLLCDITRLLHAHVRCSFLACDHGKRWLPMVMSHELRCHCRRSWPETKGGAQPEMVCRSDAVDGRNGAPRKFVYRLVSIVRKHPGARATDVHEHAKPDGAAVLGFVKHHQIERLNLTKTWYMRIGDPVCVV